MKTYITCFILFCQLFFINAQSSTYILSGTIHNHFSEKIILYGYDGLSLIKLDSTITDKKGNFSLKYPTNYIGGGLLKLNNTLTINLVLNKENLSVTADVAENSLDNIKFLNSKEHVAITQAMQMYIQSRNNLFELAKHTVDNKNESNKMNEKSKEIESNFKIVSDFTNTLPNTLYAKSYINYRQFLSDIQNVAYKYTDRLSVFEKEFNEINFSDKTLLQSGLYESILTNYFDLLQVYGEQKMYSHINKGIDDVLKDLKDNNDLLVDVSEFLFKYFEARNLIPASEHIALKMLSNEKCTIDEKRKNLFEHYSKMKKGNKAPDFIIPDPDARGFMRLSDINAQYIIIIFGSSWCPNCVEELPRLHLAYENWDKSRYEVVFVSLDTDKQAYNELVEDYMWMNYCDFQGWESEIAKEVVNAVNIPVSVKTRLGWDDSSKIIVSLAEKLQDVGIQMLAIHGRTRKQMYKGEADWELIEKVKKNPRMNIPIIGNGDIDSPQKAKFTFENYGVDAVMIGRAAIGRPWIFKEIKHYLNTGEILPDISLSEKINVLKRLLDDIIDMIGEPRGILQTRRHIAKMFKALPDFKKWRLKMLTANSYKELTNILQDILTEYHVKA